MRSTKPWLTLFAVLSFLGCSPHRPRCPVRVWLLELARGLFAGFGVGVDLLHLVMAGICGYIGVLLWGYRGGIDGYLASNGDLESLAIAVAGAMLSAGASSASSRSSRSRSTSWPSSWMMVGFVHAPCGNRSSPTTLVRIKRIPGAVSVGYDKPGRSCLAPCRSVSRSRSLRSVAVTTRPPLAAEAAKRVVADSAGGRCARR